MRALVQRVSRASVTVDGDRVAAIGPGMLVLLGVTHTDTDAEADRLAAKLAKLRIFDDEQGRINEPLGERAILCVSQFTLYGDTRKGRRPSWSAAAAPERAEPLCEAFSEALRGLGATVATGVFGADMAVSLVNDGPMTIWLDSDA